MQAQMPLETFGIASAAAISPVILIAVAASSAGIGVPLKPLLS